MVAQSGVVGDLGVGRGDFQQRVRKRQPDGGLIGDGTSPFSRIRCLRWSPSSVGAADISAAV
jgi:hypothetical protein